MGKRCEVAESGEFKVERLLCLTGGGLTTPLPLPVMEIDGQLCVPIGAYEPWVNLALDGKLRGGSGSRVSAFVAKACEALGRMDGDAVEAGTPPKAPNPTKGRAALGLDSDSEEDTLAEAGAQGREPLRSTIRSAGARAPAEWRNVSCGDEHFRLRRGKGRRVLLPIDEELPRFLRHLSSKSVSGEAAETPYKRVRSADYGLEAVDEGRIRWNDRLHSWLVRYTDEAGGVRQVTKGFRVPQEDIDGSLLPAPVQSEHRERLLRLARAAWNAADRSSSSRYPEQWLPAVGGSSGRVGVSPLDEATLASTT